jgi:hypothetical protein
MKNFFVQPLQKTRGLYCYCVCVPETERIAELQVELDSLAEKRGRIAALVGVDLTSEQSDYLDGYLRYIEDQIRTVLDALLELDPEQG